MSFRIEVNHSRADAKFSFLRRFLPEVARRWVSEGAAIALPEFTGNMNYRTGAMMNTTVAEVSDFRAVIHTTVPYAKLVDEGFPPHEIVASQGKTLRFEVDGKVFYRKRVFHPGYAGSHFKARTLASLVPKLRSLGESLMRELTGAVS